MRRSGILAGCFCLLGVGMPALAGSHMWRFSEVFSNGSGTVQFIELTCAVSGENFVSNHSVTTENGIFTFPSTLGGSTANKKLLLATAGFAALPGAPTPDYIIPANFLPINGGTLRYHPPGNYDTWVYGAGVIPVDGVSSVQFTSWQGGNEIDTYTNNQVNNPANFLGGSGSINAACLDEDGDGFGNPGDANCSGGPQTDCDDTDPDVRPNAVEDEGAGNCADGADNDCDGSTDCDEVGCANAIGPCIPTVSEWGVIILSMTILCAGSLLLRGRM